MYRYIPYPTKVVASFPSPWGTFDLIWWSQGSAPVTTAMILFGLGLSVWAVVTFPRHPGYSFTLYTVVNIFFCLLTFLGVTGCRSDGCELAQSQEVAMTWHFAFIEVSLLTMLAMVVMRLLEELWNIDKVLALMLPATTTLGVPLFYAVVAGIAGDLGPAEYLQSVMHRHDPVWVCAWAVSVMSASYAVNLQVRAELPKLCAR